MRVEVDHMMPKNKRKLRQIFILFCVFTAKSLHSGTQSDSTSDVFKTNGCHFLQLLCRWTSILKLKHQSSIFRLKWISKLFNILIIKQDYVMHNSKVSCFLHLHRVFLCSTFHIVQISIETFRINLHSIFSRNPSHL